MDQQIPRLTILSDNREFLGGLGRVVNNEYIMFYSSFKPVTRDFPTVCESSGNLKEILLFDKNQEVNIYDPLPNGLEMFKLVPSTATETPSSCSCLSPIRRRKRIKMVGQWLQDRRGNNCVVNKISLPAHEISPSLVRFLNLPLLLFLLPCSRRVNQLITTTTNLRCIPTIKDCDLRSLIWPYSLTVSHLESQWNI